MCNVLGTLHATSSDISNMSVFITSKQTAYHIAFPRGRKYICSHVPLISITGTVKAMNENTKKK